jgi:hypothetical protein
VFSVLRMPNRLTALTVLAGLAGTSVVALARPNSI